MEGIILYRQTFNIDDRILTGVVKRQDDDIYICVYENNTMLTSKICMNTDESVWLYEIENLINEIG